MIVTQNTYIDYLTKVEEELEKIEIKTDFSLEQKKEALKTTELVVPIIGAFSAGKSSLINSFLNKDYLPVGIAPETALATELRYSENEFIEGVNADGTAQKFAIDETKKIAEIAYKFKFLRMFIHSQELRNIEPLILVDMPGFESPLDLHNQAIMEYINRGVHYIVLTSAEEGTITRSMVRQLTDIQEFGRDFSFFLSKTNLKATSEVNEVADRLQEQIDEYFNLKKEVVLVDDNGGESLQKILISIDPEQLFRDLFIENLKNDFFVIMEMLNTSISSLGKDKEKNEEVIAELKESFVKIQEERDKLIEEANERYSNVRINGIINKVGRELSQSMDEIVNAAIHNGADALSSLITDIVRHVLIVEIKKSMSDIGDEIVESFSLNLTSLNHSMSEFGMSDNWLEKITDTTKNMLHQATNSLDKIVTARKESGRGESDNIYKTITSILAITTEAIAPALELLIVFLPDIINALMENYQKKKQEEYIRNTLLAQTIPSLKRELRTKLPQIFNEQVQEMINSISGQFEHIIEGKRQTLEAVQEEIDVKNIDIEERIKIYNELIKSITTLANDALYK